MSSSNKKFLALEVYRGIAAIWVVLAHTSIAINAFVDPEARIAHLFQNGGLGVELFFLLSGFIIFYAAERLAGRGGGLAQYVSSRFVRIYVPYLPVGIAMLVAYAALPDLSRGDREISLISSLTLLPSKDAPALSVAWTLVHEMIFYCIFGLYFVSRKLLWSGLILWGLAIISGNLLLTDLERLPGYFFHPINLNFLIGVLIYALSKSVKIKRSGALFGIGIICVIIASSQEIPLVWLANIGFILLIGAAISPAMEKVSIPSSLIYLGAASYSIYLVHNPAISVLVRMFHNWHLPAHSAVMFGVIATSATLAGILYYAAYESHSLPIARRGVAATIQAFQRRMPFRNSA